MSARILNMILAASLISASLVAQDGIETDDLYFNSKDRAKLNEKKANAAMAKFKRADQQIPGNDKLNPTDSYSARNVNPEYSAQGYQEGDDTAGMDNYFLPNYQPTGINQNLNNFNNSNFNNWNSWNNWRYNPYWGYGYNGFNNFYPSPWMDPFWGNPYGSFYSPGWSMSLGYAWGGWNSWYGNVGYGWNSWSPWNSFYGGWGGYGYYPSTVVVINNGENNRITYRKRPQRSSNLNHEVDRSRQLGYTRTDGVSSGRSRSSNTVYYDRSWRRNNNENSTTRSFWSNTGANNSNTRSSFNNWNNSNSDFGRQRSPGFSTPTRSSSGGSAPSGGSRSSSGSTRGRNN